MHQIENEFIQFRARETGAEPAFLLSKKTNVQHLWQAHENFWPWHAPVLFPVVGRCLNDEVEIEGKKYPMEKHGFARRQNFKLLELGHNRMVFSLMDNEDTRAIYPYPFEFLIGYQLQDNLLECIYEVRNTGNAPMWFMLGGHPAFNVPFLPGEQYSDYYLEFDETENAERHYIDGEGFFDGRTETVLAHTNTLPLVPGMFANDAYIFKNLKSRQVTLRSKLNPHYLKVGFDGFNYLGIWAKNGAPYVCIEPWLGCADTAATPLPLSQREGVQHLAPGATLVRTIKVWVG